MAEARNKITCIVIHCTDSPDNSKYGFDNIDRDHKARNFPSYFDRTGKEHWCGYHYVIGRDGVIIAARPEIYVGAHCRGYNAESLGVCWIGQREMTVLQKRSLLLLVKELMNEHRVDQSHIFGHTELNPAKTCPNFHFETTFTSMDAFRKALQQQTGGNIS